MRVFGCEDCHANASHDAPLRTGGAGARGRNPNRLSSVTALWLGLTGDVSGYVSILARAASMDMDLAEAEACTEVASPGAFPCTHVSVIFYIDTNALQRVLRRTAGQRPGKLIFWRST